MTLYDTIMLHSYIDPIWKVARYTSAAPTYFSECDNYVDGGVLANNPCEAGLAHLQEFYHNQGTRLTISCMVSVGTGIYPKKELGSLNGALGGVPRLFRLIDSAVSIIEKINTLYFPLQVITIMTLRTDTFLSNVSQSRVEPDPIPV